MMEGDLERTSTFTIRATIPETLKDWKVSLSNKNILKAFRKTFLDSYCLRKVSKNFLYLPIRCARASLLFVIWLLVIFDR